MPESGDHITEIVIDGPTDENEHSVPVERETVMAESIDLNELFRGEQARSLAQMSGNFEHTGHVLRAVENKKFDEVSIDQAISMKEAGKTGAHTDPRLPVGP